MYYHCFECAAASEVKSDDWKEGFNEELEQDFNHFPIYHMQIQLGDSMQKWWKIIFSYRQLGMMNQDSNDKSVRTVNFATSKNLVKSMMFPHQNIH
jgi:hypothetical protein